MHPLCVLLLLLTSVACDPPGAHDLVIRDTADRRSIVSDEEEIEDPLQQPTDAGSYAVPLAHLRCVTRFDITLPDGQVGGAFCAFAIRTNGVDRTCLLNELTTEVVCL